MKWQERRMSNCIVALLLIWAAAAFGQEPQPETEAPAQTELTEVEALKGENLQLKYDSIDKQMRLMQTQYQQLQAQQAGIVRQLQQLEGEILEGCSLKPGEGIVNWQEKTVQEISRRGTENAENVLEKNQ